MKYRSLDSFRNDVNHLPPEHQRLFLRVLREYVVPGIDAGSFSGTPPWPRRLRVHRLFSSEIYSMTWNSASPDGRATFHLDKNEAGEPLVVWRRVGDHSI